MGKKLTVIAQKGGVLKTTLTTNLAGIYSKKGKTLLIDTDAQGNSALSFGINPDEHKPTLYDVLMGNVHFKNAVHKINDSLDILISNDDMAFFEFDVLTKIKDYPNPFDIFRSNLEGIERDYDYILIDSPPNLGLVHGNVLCLSEDIIIPYQPESYSMRSLIKITESIQNFKETHNPSLNILGVVPTLVDRRTRLHKQILDETQKYCDAHDLNLFSTVIPRSVRFASSVAYEGMPATMVEKKSKSKIAKTIYDLEREINL